MPADVKIVEMIVRKTTDLSVSTAELLVMMKAHHITSVHLMNYIDDDQYWPVHKPDTNFKVAAKDEKYILNFSNPQNRSAVKNIREKLREAVHSRFYTGHKFGEWMI